MKLFWIECMAEKFPISILPRFLASPEIHEEPVTDKKPASLSESIVTITRPGVLLRRFGHAGPDGIEFDIAHAGQQVGVVLNDTAFMPSFPKRSAASMTMVDVCDVIPPDKLDHAAYGIGTIRRNKQMDMICHEHIGMNKAAMSLAPLFEPCQICLIIIIEEKNGLAIIPALDHMCGNIRLIETRFSWHLNILVVEIVDGNATRILIGVLLRVLTPLNGLKM